MRLLIRTFSKEPSIVRTFVKHVSLRSQDILFFCQIRESICLLSFLLLFVSAEEEIEEEFKLIAVVVVVAAAVEAERLSIKIICTADLKGITGIFEN